MVTGNPKTREKNPVKAGTGRDRFDGNVPRASNMKFTKGIGRKPVFRVIIFKALSSIFQNRYQYSLSTRFFVLS